MATFSQMGFLASISCQPVACGWSSTAHRASTAHPRQWEPHFTPESAASGRRELPKTHSGLLKSITGERVSHFSQTTFLSRLSSPSHRASCTLTFPAQIARGEVVGGGWVCSPRWPRVLKALWEQCCSVAHCVPTLQDNGELSPGLVERRLEWSQGVNPGLEHGEGVVSSRAELCQEPRVLSWPHQTFPGQEEQQLCSQGRKEGSSETSEPLPVPTWAARELERDSGPGPGVPGHRGMASHWKRGDLDEILGTNSSL